MNKPTCAWRRSRSKATQEAGRAQITAHNSEEGNSTDGSVYRCSGWRSEELKGGGAARLAHTRRPNAAPCNASIYRFHQVSMRKLEWHLIDAQSQVITSRSIVRPRRH